MIAKTFEVRDRATFIPVIAVSLNPSCEPDRYLLSRAGFGPDMISQSSYVLLMNIDGGNGKSTCDPFDWGTGSRTMHVAHQYLIANFHKLNSGDVICVEHILGERDYPKTSERLEEMNHGR